MKQYIFEFTEKGRKSFLALPKLVRNRLEKKMRFFIASDDPFSFAKKLQGSKRFYRFRVGEYRIIFTPNKKNLFVVLLILKVGHRREVYE